MTVIHSTATDFIVERHPEGGRFAYPVSPEGAEFFNSHVEDFDLSDSGIELDTDAEAFDAFVSTIAAAGLTYVPLARP